MKLKTEEFDYHLPQEIQTPLEPRDSLRLLLLDRRMKTDGKAAWQQTERREGGGISFTGSGRMKVKVLERTRIVRFPHPPCFSESRKRA